ncbi:fibronectin type III domain-containing protein [Arenibacter algicola]
MRKQERFAFINLYSFESPSSKTYKFGGLVKGFLWLLITLNCLFVSAQSFPVQLIPQVSPPPPIYFSQYADASTTNSPLRLQIILNDLEISNREIRLKTYFQGNGISFQSNDVIVGASPLFLEGGVPLVLTNVELAPYFRYENITGISPNVYGQAIPEGAYQFCYEVYDVLTGNRLSQKSCAVNVVFQNEPPFLISPRNKTLVAENNPQNIIFQWTPRSINVSNVEYELSLVEIWDTQIDSQAAFLSSPPIFQTITTSTTYVFGPADPLLLSGKNYAWRIQARAKQGAEEIGLFKNQGYSEIFSFSYAASCDLPIGINHEVKGSTNANIYWDDFTTDVPEYTIRYRQKGNTNEWFLSKTNTNQLTLWDLKAGTTYEYQLQKKCVVTGSDWSMAKQFTTFLADNKASVYQCGITPNFNLTNKEPLPKLSTGESFVAGDFPIHVLEVSGSNGRFTGKGYVTIPYLNSIRVGVEFTNVQINTDKQMSEGTVVTVYDPNLASILDVDEVVETVDTVSDLVSEPFEGDNDLDEVRVNFMIPRDSVGNYIKIKDGMVTITNPENGASISEPLGDDKVVVDGEGKVYHIDAGGNITEGGTIDPGGAVTSNNVEGISTNGQLERLTAKDIQITFKEVPGDFSFDEIPSTANASIKKEYTTILDTDGNDYTLAHQAVENGQTAYVDAIIEQTGSNQYALDNIVFKTKQGEKIPVEIRGNNTIRLTLKGRYTFENEIIYAVVPSMTDGTKQLTAGAFTLWHLTERAVKVALVSVNNASLGDIENTVTNIFNQGVAKIDFQETLALSFDKDILGTNGLDVGESAWAAAYNDEQKQLVSAVKKLPGYKNDTYYILVFGDITPSRSIAGFMPLQRQMGFVFSGSADEEGKGGDKGKVLAHELGHGIFALQHPFGQYGEDIREKTDWLMDYNGGTILPHMHWAQIHDPALKFYVFQDEEDGEYGAFEYLVGQDVVPDLFKDKIPEFSGNTISFVSPAGKFFTIPSTASDISFNKKGALWAFTVSENGKQERYVSTKWTKTGNFAGYLKQAGAKDNWNEIVYKDNASRNAPQGQLLTVYSGILEKSDSQCGIKLYVGKYPNEADRNEWNSGGNETPFVDQISIQDKTNVGNSLISSPEACDLCAKGEKFYNDYTYLIKNDEGNTALHEISKLICSTGPDAIDYDILVAQIGTDAIDTKNSFWWGTDKYLFDLAREQFWQNNDALPKYYNALKRVANNIDTFKKILKTDASKDQYYNAIYYLNDEFLKSLSSIDKVKILAHIFKEDTFITSGLFGITNNDESLIIKVLNSISENKTEATEFMDEFIKVDELYNDLQAGLDDNLDGANFTDFILKLSKLALLAYGNEVTSQIQPSYTFTWGVKNVDFVLKWVSTLRDYRFNYKDSKIFLTGKCTSISVDTGTAFIDQEKCFINNEPLDPFKDFVQITIIESINILPALCNNIETQFCGEAVVVPAIFLEYLNTKKEGKQFENLGLNIVTVAGTILSGGELAAAKVGSAVWLWAAADLTYTFSTPVLKLFREDVEKKYGKDFSDNLYQNLDRIQFIFLAKGASDLLKTTPKNVAASIASKKVIGDDDFYKLLKDGILKDQPKLSEVKVKEIIDDAKAAMNKLESELSPELLDEEIVKAKKLLVDYPSTSDWTSVLEKNIYDLAQPPKGYQFYTRNGNKWIRRIDASDLNTPRLTVKDGKIVSYTGATIGSFTVIQIRDYIELTTKNADANKVMFGMWDGGGASSYVTKAGNNHTYFDFGEKWDEAYKLVNESDDEIWRINKEFIDQQRAANKEFWFSHDPFSPKNEQFFAREVNYLIDLGVTDFVKENDLWKALW